MKDSVEHPVHSIANLLKKIGEEEHIEILIEQTWEHVGRITRRDGSYSYFRGAHFDLNGMGSMEIARDKGYAAYFLQKAGYQVIPGRTFYSPPFAKALQSTQSLDAAYAYAKAKLGLPVVLKPNSGTQGELVCVAHDKRMFMRAARKICRKYRVFLVQPLLSGRDYRVVILDNSVISAYERLPLAIIGDGASTIDELIDAKQRTFSAQGRDTKIKKDDFRIDERLKRNGLNRQSILAKGYSFALLDNRNLSTGGEAIDVTDAMHQTYRDLAVRIVHDMGLRYCGVDFMIGDDIRKPLDPRLNPYAVIEINAAPGVDNYAAGGDAQKKIVKDMYRRILRTLAGREVNEKK